MLHATIKPQPCSLWRFEAGRLFDLDEINWAFIRPKTPTDRPMAYAQGAWMVEYLDEIHGEEALVELLGHYFDGRPEHEAISSVLGLDRARVLRAVSGLGS